MKQKIGLIAGCSHIAGAEINGNMDDRYNRRNSYGSLLVEKLGYTPVNIAINGATNSGIARSVLRWFEKHYDAEKMEVFVVVGWTESSRLEVPAQLRPANYLLGNPAVEWYDSSSNSFVRINFGWHGDRPDEKEMIPKYHKFMAENPLMLENWSATYVLQIQYFLNSLNIPYVMSSTMHMFQPKEHFTSYLIELIDESRYYNLRTNQDESFYWKYKNLGYENSKAKYWHHDEEPHRLYAEELHKFIGEQQ